MAGYRALNVKQMILAYRSASSEEEKDSLWDAFVTLRDHGFISPYEWKRFFDISFRDWLAEDPTIEA